MEYLVQQLPIAVREKIQFPLLSVKEEKIRIEKVFRNKHRFMKCFKSRRIMLYSVYANL